MTNHRIGRTVPIALAGALFLVAGCAQLSEADQKLLMDTKAAADAARNEATAARAAAERAATEARQAGESARAAQNAAQQSAQAAQGAAVDAQAAAQRADQMFRRTLRK